MKTKKSYVWFALIFIGIAATATVFAYPDSTGNAVQADEREIAAKIAANSMNHPSSVITKVNLQSPGVPYCRSRRD